MMSATANVFVTSDHPQTPRNSFPYLGLAQRIFRSKKCASLGVLGIINEFELESFSIGTGTNCGNIFNIGDYHNTIGSNLIMKKFNLG